MGFFRPQIILRWLIIAWAAAFLAVGTTAMLLRRCCYLEIADAYAAAAKFEDRGLDPEANRVLNRYYDGLSRKYEFAANHPWHRIEPDPPAPVPNLKRPSN